MGRREVSLYNNWAPYDLVVGAPNCPKQSSTGVPVNLQNTRSSDRMQQLLPKTATPTSDTQPQLSPGMPVVDLHHTRSSFAYGSPGGLCKTATHAEQWSGMGRREESLQQGAGEWRPRSRNLHTYCILHPNGNHHSKDQTDTVSKHVSKIH